MQQVVFRLLGPPEILYKDQPIKIPRRRSRALLYYLISTQSPQPRERLLTFLCGDVDEESARKTFKTLLAEVRAQLRGFDPNIEWIINDGDQLKLNPRAPLWLDTEIFEKVTAVTSRNLHQAIDLYRGNFLDGFFLKDAPDFDAWVRSARDHFHRLYLTTLRRLAELYEAEDQLEQAVTCMQMSLATDPLLEEAYARLMRLYWMSGNRIEAIRQYERLCIVLAEELAVKPSSATQELYEQIARQGTWSLPTIPAPPNSTRQAQAPEAIAGHLLSVSRPESSARLPLTGRMREMEWLQHHLSGTREPYPLLLLQGEPGIGKSCLLQEISECLGSSWLIARGACQEVEMAHPYHAIVEALRRGLAAENLSQLSLPRACQIRLAQLLPDRFQLASVVSEPGALEPLALASALVELLNGLARPQRPLLLVLDDLHWADRETLALLGHLALHVERGRVFLLGAYCAALARGRLEPLKRSLQRQNALLERSVPPLTGVDLKQLLVHALLGTRHTELTTEEQVALLDWCEQRSEGNPFFALAWLSRALENADGVRLLAEAPTPEPVTLLVRQQLAQLSRDAFLLLSTAAIPGSSFDLLAAAHLLHFTPHATIEAGDELLQAGLIAEAPPGRGRYIFAHRVVRDVLLAAMSPVQRQLFQQATRE